MVQHRRDPEQRPLPEALLEAAKREHGGAGRLKIFVGAAPGVGKTYEMLQSAHARLKAGADIVVGFVETHRRAETEALLRGLEIVPRKRLDYRGQVVEEMDLDRCLAIQMPYLGPVKGYYTDWTPLTDRPGLFPEDIDTSDPWQFKNVLVR